MGGRMVVVTWQGHEVRAWVPDTIGDRELPVDVGEARSAERAIGAVRRMGDRATGPMEAVARLLLRSEGLASSAIEGLRVDPDALAVAAAGGGGEPIDGVVADVAGNLRVLTELLAVRGALTPDHLLTWHRLLMERSDLPGEMVGAWRDRVGWVGGATPLVAAHVAAPPERIADLMDDLLAFVSRTDVDPVTMAAVAHAQFETIHPFADGNGRIGRALIGWILVRGLEVPVPPPVSVAFARDIGGYLAGLTLYRQGELVRWGTWFAEVVERSATLTASVLDDAVALQADWTDRISDLRADATARRVVDDLPAHPAMTVALVAERCGTSEPTARTALDTLAERGILSVMVPTRRPGPGRPPQWLVAHELLALLGG